MNYFDLLKKIVQHKVSYLTGNFFVLPFNLTVSITEQCNSHCATCNIHRTAMTRHSPRDMKINRCREGKGEIRELSLEEYRRIFDSFGNALYWVTIFGGEPFLREDIDEICTSLYKKCRPRFITIPTNGILCSVIEKKIRKIIQVCHDSKIVVNISLDHIGSRHDKIRNVNNNYEYALETLERLKSMKSNNLSVGVNTIISKYNYPEIDMIQYEIKKLNPDSYLAEPAQKREELKNEKGDFMITDTETVTALKKSLEKLMASKQYGTAKITKAFRMEYYRRAIQTLEGGRRKLPCYAGFASLQIYSDGRVTACGVNSALFGYLHTTGFSIKRLLSSAQAVKLRKSLKKQNCTCMMANISYINTLFNIASLCRIGFRLA